MSSHLSGEYVPMVNDMCSWYHC